MAWLAGEQAGEYAMPEIGGRFRGRSLRAHVTDEGEGISTVALVAYFTITTANEETMSSSIQLILDEVKGTLEATEYRVGTFRPDLNPHVEYTYFVDEGTVRVMAVNVDQPPVVEDESGGEIFKF